jgi:hypothetical protein
MNILVYIYVIYIIFYVSLFTSSMRRSTVTNES